MAHRSDEIEMHVETRKYQSYSGKTEEIVPDCTANSKRHLHLAYLSIGLLCVLQTLLNIILRVSWNESRAPTETSFPNQTLTGQNEELQSALDNMVEERNLLQSAFDSMVEERNLLQSALDSMVEERNLLQSTLDSMVEERNLLQSALDNMVEERNLLQSALDNMVEERNLLQSSLDNMVEERNRLQTAFNTSLKKQEALLKTLNGEGNLCTCWQNNICSCYYKSHSKKNWNDSRKDCRERGSDLIVVNSKEEQDFVPLDFWLGLTDAEVEGTWKWVDGTPLTTAYWGHPQPDNNGPAPNKEEDCVENYGMDGWNDASCLADRYWICEKKLDVSIV